MNGYEIGFLQPMLDSKRFLRQGRGQYKLVLVRTKRSGHQGKSARSALVEELTKRGVWADMAPALAEARPEEEIRRYLALHDWLLSRRDKRIAKNPAGFLAACIANQLPLPKDFEIAQGQAIGQKSRPAAERSGTSTIALPSRALGAEWEAIERDLARLTDAQRAELESDAVRAAKPFVASTYERLRKEGGALFDEVRHALLVEHLTRQRIERQADVAEPGLSLQLLVDDAPGGKAIGTGPVKLEEQNLAPGT